MGVAAVPACIQFVGFFWLPESPRYLAQNGDVERAAAVLRKLRGGGSPEQARRDLLALANLAPEDIGDVRAGLREIRDTPHLRSIFKLGLGLMCLQQFSGINTVMYLRPRGDGSRRSRGCDVDSPWRRVAATSRRRTELGATMTVCDELLHWQDGVVRSFLQRSDAGVVPLKDVAKPHHLRSVASLHERRRPEELHAALGGPLSARRGRGDCEEQAAHRGRRVRQPRVVSSSVASRRARVGNRARACAGAAGRELRAVHGCDAL